MERKKKGYNEKETEKKSNVLLFSQSSSSDVLNFHNFSKNGVFQYAAFIMKTSWWNLYALVTVWLVHIYPESAAVVYSTSECNINYDFRSPIPKLFRTFLKISSLKKC